MNFDLGNKNFPLQISTSSNEKPSLSLQWSFRLAFGFDEKDGFFLYTFPDEGSEFFVRADFTLPVTRTDAKLLYFLKLSLDDLDIAFGAGIFVDIGKFDIIFHFNLFHRLTLKHNQKTRRTG
jgi:hypothetical protein